MWGVLNRFLESLKKGGLQLAKDVEAIASMTGRGSTKQDFKKKFW